jgi:pimeloyl-ACP methyl ester carboxylesterase
VPTFTHRALDQYLRPVRTLPMRTPAAVGLNYTDVDLLTDDDLRLAAWYVPGAGAEALILVHGLAANRDDLLDLAFDLHQRGYPLLLLDLRAHGRSQGATSTLGVKEVRDIRAAVRFLQAQPELASDGIGVYGNSLGGSVALHAAAALPELKAVVVDSTFASVRWIVDHQLQALLKVPDWFGGVLLAVGSLEAGINVDDASPMAAAQQLGDRPLLIIHGSADQTFQVANAQLIHAAASGPRDLWILDGVGHSEAYSRNPTEYVARVDALFASAR